MIDQKNIDKLQGILEGLQAGKISKGLVENFTYNSKLEIAKSGKELKVLFAKVMAGLTTKCDEKKSQITILQSLINAGGTECLPLQNPSSYLYQGLRKEAFSYIPKMFSYDQKYGPEQALKSYDEPVEMGGGSYATSDLNKATNPAAKPDAKIKGYMNSYNECVRSYLSAVSDKLFLGALIESIKDNQQIKLTGSILKLLV